jgi:hypothetical protein
VCEFKDGKWVGTFDKPEAKVAVQYYYDLVNKHRQLFFNAAIQKLIANNITPDDFCE